MTPFQERVGRVAVQWLTGMNNVAYGLSAGRVAGHLASGAPLCLLTTTGRRSGRARTVPLLYVRDGEDLVVVASRGGSGTHPAWYLNLRDRPDALVQLGAERLPVRARDATPEERTRLWGELTAVYPHFDAYQARTDRRIPVVVLSPR